MLWVIKKTTLFLHFKLHKVLLAGWHDPNQKTGKVDFPNTVFYEENLSPSEDTFCYFYPTDILSNCELS
jgi:hypothetical protein